MMVLIQAGIPQSTYSVLRKLPVGVQNTLKYGVVTGYFLFSAKKRLNVPEHAFVHRYPCDLERTRSCRVKVVI